MAKKIREDEDFDDLENEFDDDSNEDITPDNDSDDDSDDTSNDEEISISDDEDDNIDIIIEIDEDDLNLIEESDSETKPEESESDGVVLSKHKIEGKHSLKYDSIFKGKKEDPLDEEEGTTIDMYQKDTIEVDRSSNYYFESIDNEKYIRSKEVKEKVYEVLAQNTTINFLNNRRKPSRADFNQYYNILKSN